MSSTSIDDLQETLQELHRLESVIVKQFSSSPPPPSTSIERKLVLLEDVVERIPKRFPDLVDKWRGKFASLMQKLSAISNLGPNDDDNEEDAKDFNSDSKSISSKARAFENGNLIQFSPVGPNRENATMNGTSSLETELIALESAISKMLATNPRPVELDVKLSELMEKIGVIPAELSDKWTDKASALMEMYTSCPEAELVQINDGGDNCGLLKNPFGGLLREVANVERGIVKNLINFSPAEVSTLRPVQTNGSPARSAALRLSNACVDSPSSTMSHDSEPPFLDRLRPELESLENDICKMLSHRPLPVSELELKLAIFAKSIDKIPSECPETANNWNKKFIYLKEKYKRVQLRAQQEETTGEVPRLLTKTLSIEHIPRQLVSSVPTVPVNSSDVPTNPFVEFELKLKDCETIISKHISDGDYDHAGQSITDFRRNIFLFEKLCAVQINQWNDKLSDFNRTMATEQAHTVQPLSTNLSMPPVKNNSAGNSLETKLTALESDILRMLSMKPMPSTVEDKLSSLMELITSIDSANKGLSDKWNSKAAELMQRFASTTVDNVGDVHVELKNGSIAVPSNGYHYQPSSSLEQNLISLEAVILKLFNSQVPPISELDDKICEFIELFSTIPDDNSVLLNLWSDKLTDVMERYATLSMASTGCEEAVPLSRSSSLDDLRLWLSMTDDDVPTETKKPQSSSSAMLNESINSNKTDSSYFVKPTNSGNSTVTREEIRSRIESAIGKLNQVKDDDDIDGIGSLLMVAAKARKAMDPFFPDKLLHNDIFSWTLDKLTDQINDLYGTTVVRKNLNSLINFMRNYISDYCSDQKCVDKLTGAEVDDNNLISRSDSACGMICNYCKLVGHRTSTCPKIKNMLCFKCLEYGHGVKRCINDELSPAMVTF